MSFRASSLRSSSIVLAACVFASSCGGCREKKDGNGAQITTGGAAAGGCTRSGTTVKIALATLPNTLDWNKSHEASFVNYPVIHAMMRGLTALDASYRPVPALAERWDVELTKDSPPRQVYTFHLKKGVVWSDGKTPLTAHDFVFGWRRAASVGAEVAEYADVVGIDEVLAAREAAGSPEETKAKIEAALQNFAVTAVDDSTLRVTLKAPKSYFLSRVALTYPFFPSPSRDLASLPEEKIQRYFNEPAEGKPMVLGAFEVKTWDRVAQTIRMARNPHDEEGPRDRAGEQLQLLQADLAAVLYDQCKIDFLLMDDPSTLASSPPDLKRTPLLSTYFLGMNTTKVPLPLRRAIAHALDREKLTRGLLPVARTAWTFLPPEMPLAIGADDPAAKSFPRYDVAAAKKLVAESGYSGEELSLLVRGSSTFLPELGIADAVRRQLKEAGIEVRVVSSANFTNDIKTQDGALRHHLFLKRVGADYAHPQTLFTAFLPTGNHYTDWHKIPGVADEFVGVLARGAAEVDDAAARDLFTKAQSMLISEQVAIVPLYFPDRYYRLRPWIEGLGVDAFNFLTLRSMRLAAESAEPKR